MIRLVDITLGVALNGVEAAVIGSVVSVVHIAERQEQKRDAE